MSIPLKLCDGALKEWWVQCFECNLQWLYGVECYISIPVTCQTFVPGKHNITWYFSAIDFCMDHQNNLKHQTPLIIVHKHYYTIKLAFSPDNGSPQWNFKMFRTIHLPLKDQVDQGIQITCLHTNNRVPMITCI